MVIAVKLCFKKGFTKICRMDIIRICLNVSFGGIFMKIIHTSDWHLGKSLEGFSRLEEQEKFIEDFILIVEENNADLVIISGDIYDNGNPPAKAENLFYRALKSISNYGKRAVLLIAGNHDNPERLAAASPLAYEHGIIILGTPKTIVTKGTYGEFEIVDSGEGFIELVINEEKVVILTIAYPSEKRLNEIFNVENDEDARVRSYSQRVGQLFLSLSSKFREDTINIATSHLFMLGGDTTDSERPIELGGTLAVSADMLPEKAQYVALGHLHRPQKVKGTELEAYYSGSPLQYSKSEIGYSKSCNLIQVKVGEKAKVEILYFKNYKPIEIWKCNGVSEAIEMCRVNSQKDIWVYLEIKTEEFISTEDIKTMRDLKQDIIQIRPDIKGLDELETAMDNINEKSMEELFTNFYTSQRLVTPSNELMQLFLEIAGEEEEYEA
jgi:DNA repair protein SbcD/Mre11